VLLFFREKLEKEKRWKQEVAQKKQQMQEELELTRAERLHQAFIHSKFIKEALDETDSPAWRLGIQKRKEREQRKIHFHKKMIEQRKTKHALITAKLRHIIENDLNEFDARNKTINQKQGEDTTIIPTCKSLGSTSAPPSPEHTSEAFAERIKQQRLNREKKREDMERKRRKFLQECLFRQSKLNETRVNNVLQDLVLRETNFELEAKKQMKNILKYKEVCQENRIRRDANYQAQLETDAQKEIERDTQQYQHLVQRYGDDISIQHSQKDRFALAELASAHYSNVETATEIVKDILEFMIQIAAKREHTMYTRSQVSTIFLQADTWEENKVMFANKGNQENSEDLLNIFQLQKYLQHFQAESIEEEILERGQYDKSLFVGSEKKLPERFALGEAIKYVRHLSTSSIVPDGQTRSQHQRVIPNFPIKILLFGQPFAGKRTQAYHLADKYNLQVISVLELIDQARTDSSEVSNELKFEITNNLRNGQEISPQIYSRLVLDALSSIPVLEKQGWILYDLPGTHVHAQSLEEHLSGYIDPSLIPTLDDHESILAPGFPREKLPLDFFHGKSGIHLVFDLQTQENNLEERCFGHLQDGTTKEEFHLIYAPQPDPSGIARHRLQQKFVEQHHRNENTSNIVTGVTCEHLSLVQYQSESHFQGSFREWYTKFNTLQIVDANDSVEATTAQMVATIDNLLVKQAANHQMAMQKREEGENVKMESEEVRQRNYAQMEQAIINAKEEVAKAQQAVHAAEVQKAKKNELAELRGCVGSANKQLEACLTEAEEMIKEERIGLGSTKKAYSGVLEPEIAKMIANTWSQMEQTFIEEMKESFTTLRNARISLEDKSKSIVDEFMAFLRRVDNKQTVMIKFQQMFNCVEADMRFENETKEELHARTDVLQKDLCHVVNAKTTENQIELDYVLKEGWKENQTRQLAAIFHRMLQAEGDRFRTSIQVLIDGNIL
jgi:hypothetical protein